MKKLSILKLTILLFSSFSYAQYVFDFEENAQQFSTSAEASTVEQTVNGVTLTVTTDNDTSHTKFTQRTDLTGVLGGVDGHVIATSWRNNTFHFEFSEPVYLGTILAARLGAGYIEQVITDDTSVPVRSESTHHVGNKTIALGWENVTSFKIENDVSVTATPIFDDITFIPMDEFVNTVTHVPDNVFEQRLIDNGWDDVLDNYVATPNIIFQIILDVTGVKDLTGIEDFASLRYFYCRNSPNLEGELDLTNNLNIEAVYVNNSKITNLNLSTNSALQYVSTEDNLLTNISLPTDADLISAQFDNNNLTNLNFSNYPSLERLELDNNMLTSLNLANGNNNDLNIFSAIGNPDLSCIEVSNVSFATNNYTQVDSGVVFSTDCASLSIDDFEIETFSFYPNPATSILNIKAKQDYNYLLVDVAGKIVALGELVLGDNIINLRKFESGVFFLQVTNQQTIFTKKIIKK